MTREFDYQDYRQNPIKYQHFKTAVINTDQLPDFKADSHVGIEYLDAIYDGMICKAKIPVYKVMGIDGNCSYLFANSLRDFVL